MSPTVGRLAGLVLAQAGFRLDRPRLVSAVVALALLFGASWVASRNDVLLTLACFVFAWFYYYVGNGVVLGTRLREQAIRRLGREAALSRYEVVLGSMFAAQGLGVAVMSSLDQPGWVLPLPALLCQVVGATLFVLGSFVRLWATYSAGLDTLYYRDLFLREPSTGTLGGPYRWLTNPMYGVGQLHSWGFALYSRSLAGLAAAALCQLALYAFYALVERPFVARSYRTWAPRTPHPDASGDLATALNAHDVSQLRDRYNAQNELVYAHDFLPQPLISELYAEAEALEPSAVRKHIPLYKKSASVSFHELNAAAPAVLALYRSPSFKALLEGIVGRELECCPESDAHACALYFYTEAGDHIGWHYDSSHYRGARFTVLIGLCDTSSGRLLGQLYRGLPGREVQPLSLATPPGTTVIFNGDKLYHSVSPIAHNERRVVLSLEYVTDTHMGRTRRFIAGMKDAIAYFGFRHWLVNILRRRRD